MEVIAGPAVEVRPAQHCLGIRTIAPFRGMLAVRDQLMSELYGWLDGHSVSASSLFLRLHVIDMKGAMDIEVGAIQPGAAEGDGRVTPGLIPAGRYATLTYRDHSLRANRMLIEWADANDVHFDRDTVAAGDRYACRYELFVTDPRTEPRRTRWIVQLNFLTRPNSGSE